MTNKATLGDPENTPGRGTSEEDRKLLQSAGTVTQRQGGRWHTVGMPAESSRDFGATLRRLGHLLDEERPMLIVALLLTIGSVVLVALGPRLLGNATDIIVSGVTGGGPGIDYGRLHNTLLLVLVLYLVSWVLSYGQAYLLAGVVQRSMLRLRRSVEDKLNRLPLSYIDGQPRGDLLSRVTNDIDNLAQSLQQTTSQIISSLLNLLAVTVMMFTISAELALIALVTVPASVWLMKRIAAKARPRYMAQWRITGTLNAQAEEVFGGHAIVKAFGRQREAEARFRADNNQLHEASLRAQFISGLIQPLMMFMGNVQYLLLAVVGGLRISSGAASVGDVQALIQYSRQFAHPLTHLASMASTFQSGIASLERVLELLDAEELSPEPPLTGEGPGVVGRVVFDDVTFSYSPDKPLIEGLSVVAEPGQTIAIVGPTGAGKTTLVNLVMRFYELDSGRITLDGRDIATISRHELRSHIGMVLQDTWLFGSTIWDNVAYGNPAASAEQILEAARATYVDRFVRALPDGYDTVVKEDGDNLSAGQKQLITIARVFLADPAILILDEATSSVDTRTEVLIQQAMNRLRAHRTSFVIAHRLSTIRGADVILVVENGHIVEQGSHQELLRHDGPYRRLYNSQFAGAAAEFA